MRRTLGIAALALCAGCVNPRSIVVGQSPRMLTQGDVEVGLSTGIAWDSLASSSGTGGYATVQVPATEANVAIGMGSFDLNLHASTAGIQPGVKIALPSSGMLQMALLPSLAAGFYAGSTSASSGTTTTSSPVWAFTALGGVKFLASLPVGVYGAVGYDFQLFRYGAETGMGGSGSTSGLTSHHLNLAFGYEFTLGQLRLRPEFALSYSPAVYQDGAPSGTDPMTELMVFPNITFAFAGSTNPGGAR